MKQMDFLKDKIRNIPNFPKEGVNFKDITPLLEDPQAFKQVCEIFHNLYKFQKIDKIVGIDARGFIFGSTLAYLLGVGFTPARKKGKLPFDTITEKFECEYGVSEMEMHKDALKKGDRVIIIDDLLATGGTAMAAVNLVQKLGGEVVECAFVIGLNELPGAFMLEKFGIPVFTLLNY
jgi:adenine phosphoribosyltransferase